MRREGGLAKCGPKLLCPLRMVSLNAVRFFERGVFHSCILLYDGDGIQGVGHKRAVIVDRDEFDSVANSGMIRAALDFGKNLFLFQSTPIFLRVMINGNKVKLVTRMRILCI